MLTQRSILIVLAVTLGWYQGAGAEPVVASQNLVYAASYKNLDIGSLEISIRARDDGYLVESRYKPSQLGSLFIKKYTNKVQFVRRDGSLAMAWGNEDIRGSVEAMRMFGFDYDKRVVRFNNGVQHPFLPDAQFESAAFPLILLHRTLPSIAGTEVSVVDTKRVRQYRYGEPSETQLVTPTGSITCWKITRTRIGNPDQWVSVWLSKTENPLPLRIDIRNKGRTYSLRLAR